MTDAKPVQIVAREDEVVVLLVDLSVSPGGIHLPKQGVSDARFAEVISVGPGYPGYTGHVEINLKPGDMVLLRPNRGVPFTFKGENYLVLSCHDIPVVFREGD